MPKDLTLHTKDGRLLASATRLTDAELRIWLIQFNDMHWHQVALSIVASPKRKIIFHNTKQKQ